MPEKLKMHSPDLVQSNIDRIAELFPNCVTEATGDGGRVTRKIDFDLLRQELSDEIVEGPLERYHLNWPGKREAILAANAPIAKALRPCREESVDFEQTRNLFIEGDNLEAPQLLRETYLGKVKMIYIDPPYNTGNDLIYADDFAARHSEYLGSSLQANNASEHLVANTEANGRFHSDWLSMIAARLRVAKNLLSQDGTVFISVDDNEDSAMKLLCDEIFGERRFIQKLIWKSRLNKDNRSLNGVSKDHEYILVYGKALRGESRDPENYSNPDNDPRGRWTSANMVGLASKEDRPNLHYRLVDPTTKIEYVCPDRGWRYDRTTMRRLIESNSLIWPQNPTGRPRRKKFFTELESEFTGVSSIFAVGIHTRDGTVDVEKIFGERVFDFPKPEKLMELLVEQASIGVGDLVLDLFAGSATLAVTIQRLNVSNGLGAAFIGCQIDEPYRRETTLKFETIADVSIARMARCAATLKELSTAIDSDVGFRVLKIDSSNMKDVYYSPQDTSQALLGGLIDNIKPDRSGEDLLFQVLLDCGVDLGLPIRTEKIDGHEVFFVNDSKHAPPDLVACFDPDLSESLIKTIAEKKPLRAVFRDHCFATDADKINVEQIFKQMSPGTQLRSL